MNQRQLAEFFATFKAKQERKKKALERKKQKQLDNIKRKEEKTKKRLEKQLYDQQRIIHVYHSRYVDRFQADDEVYATREQLKMAEGRGEGKINWELWQDLVNKTRKQLFKK